LLLASFPVIFHFLATKKHRIIQYDASDSIFVLQNIDLVEDSLTQPACLIRFCIVIQAVQGQMVTNAFLDQRSVLFG